jgi:hypothetical protein
VFPAVPVYGHGLADHLINILLRLGRYAVFCVHFSHSHIQKEAATEYPFPPIGFYFRAAYGAAVLSSMSLIPVEHTGRALQCVEERYALKAHFSSVYCSFIFLSQSVREDETVYAASVDAFRKSTRETGDNLRKLVRSYGGIYDSGVWLLRVDFSRLADATFASSPNNSSLMAAASSWNCPPFPTAFGTAYLSLLSCPLCRRQVFVFGGFLPVKMFEAYIYGVTGAVLPVGHYGRVTGALAIFLLFSTR